MAGIPQAATMIATRRARWNLTQSDSPGSVELCPYHPSPKYFHPIA
jgi:hypothetical protein